MTHDADDELRVLRSALAELDHHSLPLRQDVTLDAIVQLVLAERRVRQLPVAYDRRAKAA